MEFALLLPLLSTLLLATADLTILASRAFQVQSLAQAGAGAIASLPTIPAASQNRSSPQSANLPGGIPRGAPNALPEWELSSSRTTSAPNALSIAEKSPRGSVPTSSGLPILLAELPTIIVGDLVSLPEGAAATSRLFWGCSIKAQLVTAQAPDCPDGSRAAAYAEVVVRAPVNRLVAWPDRLLSEEVEARAVVRLG